jgi:hypothetical protein
MNNLKLVLLSILMAIILFVFQKQKQIECNSPNSIAEKTNFGNKNCLK